MYVFTFFTYIVAWPTSVLLDVALGEEIGTVYSRNQLKRLVMMYSRIKDSEFHEVGHTRSSAAPLLKCLGDFFLVGRSWEEWEFHLEHVEEHLFDVGACRRWRPTLCLELWTLAGRLSDLA